MTYYEAYSKANSFGELKGMAIHDTKVAMILGANEDRLRAIEDAMNKVALENGWCKDGNRRKES